MQGEELVTSSAGGVTSEVTGLHVDGSELAQTSRARSRRTRERHERGCGDQGAQGGAQEPRGADPSSSL